MKEPPNRTVEQVELTASKPVSERIFKDNLCDSNYGRIGVAGDYETEMLSSKRLANPEQAGESACGP